MDVAYSEGCRADSTLLSLIETAIGKQNVSGKLNTNPDINNAIFRPPFPMPYTEPHSTVIAHHHKGDILSYEFRAGSSITAEQADIPCREIDEEVLWRSLAALVGLCEDATQAKKQWIQNDVRSSLLCCLQL